MNIRNPGEPKVIDNRSRQSGRGQGAKFTSIILRSEAVPPALYLHQINSLLCSVLFVNCLFSIVDLEGQERETLSHFSLYHHPSDVRGHRQNMFLTGQI